MPKGTKLTVKQKRFVNEYVKEGNGTKAIIQAGYNVEDDRTASVMASENLVKPNVKEAIEKALVDLDLTPNWVLSKHKSIAEDHEKKDAMISERALENIGKIANLYPNTRTDLELSDGKLKISWE